MSKFNTNTVQAPKGAMQTTTATRTYNGGRGFQLDPKSELFAAASTSFLEPKYYENASKQLVRIVELVRSVTKTDPTWVASFAQWLRQEANMRSVSIVVAAEYVYAGGSNGRAVVNSVLQRADEPAEMLGYWNAVHGRKLPAAVKRGVADATKRLYNEYTLLKYDNSGAWRFGDVLQMVHSKPTNEKQSSVFKYALDRRYGNSHNVPENLEAVRASEALVEKISISGVGSVTDADLQAAGWTWERLSSYGAVKWDKIIPSMGYMALMRNLRNFDNDGITDASYKLVVAKLTDPAQVDRSRQLPFRFYSAYVNASIRWHMALETAAQLSIKNLPAVKGKTLVLVDVSGSMQGGYSARGSVTPATLASLFGCAMAHAWDADVVAFATGSEKVKLNYSSILNNVGALQNKSKNLGYGTNIWQAVSQHAGKQYERVIVLTDMQTSDSLYEQIDTPFIYSFDLTGYGKANLSTSAKGRFVISGLNDQMVKSIPTLERGRAQKWPWES